jgi:iron complex transport system permease protein
LVDVRPLARAAVASAALSAVLAAVVLLSAGVGPVPLPPGVVARALLDSLPGLSFDVAEPARVIVLQVRAPRIALGALVGFALATAGTVMQGFFRNPLADPSVVGVSSGAAVGAVAAIVAPLALPFGLEIQTAAFAGALATAFGVYLVASEGGRTPVATLLLAGVAVQTFLGAVTAYLLLHAGESLERVVYWLMGHLSTATWGEVHAAALALPVALLAFPYARDLNVLLLGEADAHSLGVEVERTKRLLLAVASLVTGAAVAVSGVIGFVGLVVPHVCRLVVGPDHRVLLPTSALAGAAFLVATDTVARSGPAEVPVGIVTAAVGAPFFLFLLRRREVHEL